MNIKKEKKKFSELVKKMDTIDSEAVDHIINLSGRNPLITVSEDSTIRLVLQIFAETGTHSVSVLDPLSAFSKIGFVLTQSDLINWLDKHIEELGKLKNLSIYELGLVQHCVFSIQQNVTALEAFRMMARHKLHSCAVVDEDGVLLGNISAKDIKGIKDESSLSILYLPARSFIGKLHEREKDIQYPVFSCQQSSTLAEVIHRLSFLKRHRLYVENTHKRPVGVVSLNDIVRIIFEVACS